MTTPSLAYLGDLAEWARRHGVSKVFISADGAYEIEFFPARFVAADEKALAEPVKEVDAKQRSGKDGLTPAEQMALYGRVVDKE